MEVESRARQLANLKPYQPGVSGNPNGRPVGSRQSFSAGFLRDLAQVWQEHGHDTMVHTAKTQPATFFAVCARLIGPEVKLTIEQSSTWQLERPGLGDHARDCRRRENRRSGCSQ